MVGITRSKVFSSEPEIQCTDSVRHPSEIFAFARKPFRADQNLRGMVGVFL